MTVATQSFKWYGLLGAVLLGAGLTCGVLFRNASPWPAETKRLLYPVALTLGVAGSLLLGCFVQRRPLRTLKAELVACALLVVTLVLTKQ